MNEIDSQLLAVQQVIHRMEGNAERVEARLAITQQLTDFELAQRSRRSCHRRSVESRELVGF